MPQLPHFCSDMGNVCYNVTWNRLQLCFEGEFWGGVHAAVQSGESAFFPACDIVEADAGCTVDAAAPAQGDVRLVPLSGSASTTAPCDNVHFGGVEIFNDGQWGKICNGVFSPRNADFTVAAQVVCRQLGFPFGGLYDVVEVGVSDYQDYSSQADVVWATRLECAGNEERLDDCFFPEDASLGRGASGDGSAESPASGSAGSPRSADVPEAGFAFESTAGSGTAASPTSDDAFAPAPGPSSFFGDDDYATIYESFGAFEPDSAYAAGPTSDGGILFAQCSRRDSRIFGVVCRKFELEGAPPQQLVRSSFFRRRRPATAETSAALNC